jgi:predicted TIM-barrel fold metal-dependent hydrolase
MRLFDENKIDCHAHVYDPANFPYQKETPYRPAGQEIGTAKQYFAVMKTYGVKYSLLVQPNSGYAGDNSCMLDAIARGKGALKGVAIAAFDSSLDELRALKRQGIVGIAFNPTFYGSSDPYKPAEPLIKKLVELDMFMQIQSENDQLLLFVPWIEALPIKVLIDHCGRPAADAGLKQSGFQALLRLARTGRVSVKISGYPKFSRQSYPFEDCRPYVGAIVEAFTLDHCMWASDWPFLRAAERQDYGPLIELAGLLFPDAADRRKLFWETPRRLFGFGQ